MIGINRQWRNSRVSTERSGCSAMISSPRPPLQEQVAPREQAAPKVIGAL
jgi:hypothetical protein